ncbi:MAG: CoA ester lyase [Pseudomonadota bacterium]
MTANRTWMFAPGNHPRKVEKVFQVGADVVILDLEDAVAAAEKAATRDVVVAALQAPRPCRGYIRVNSTDTAWCFRDVFETLGAWLDGFVLPKVESPEQLQTIDWLMQSLERERGIEPGTLDLMPIVETALGITNLEAICDSGTRVRRLAFGAGDYHHDIACEWTPEETALADARSRLVRVSRAAGLEPPIDTVVIHINDDERLRASAQRGREYGFQGKLVIHPRQVDACNEIFSPKEAEVAHARSVIAAFERAEAAGSASIQLDGYFIDYPIVERAKRIVALADATSAER